MAVHADFTRCITENEKNTTLLVFLQHPVITTADDRQ